MTSTPIQVNCPTCAKADTWQPSNRYKPFCSERCKLIDLGAWADESRRVAGEPIDMIHISDEE